MNARIFIVEDESIVQLDLQRRLERMGYSVVGVASRGEEAVARVIEIKPDLVIMDIRLDGPMDGIEAARRIRELQGPPVIYVTAYAGALENAQQQDVFGPCLSKPFRTTELQSAIARTLGRGSGDDRDTREGRQSGI
jgi:CheY-like chemotaxis protein